MKILLSLFLILITDYSYGQKDNQFEKFNKLLNKGQNEVLKTLKEEFKIKKIERIEKSIDSVRLVFRTKSPRKTYTLFITNDTLKYIGVTFFTLTTSDLETLLRSRFDQGSLDELKGDIFETYSNEKHIALGLFKDKLNRDGYLFVQYPEHSVKHSNVVIWTRK